MSVPTNQLNSLSMGAPQNGSQESLARMSSIDIAHLTKKRHDNVKRTIEDLAQKGLVHPQSEVEWSTDGLGRPRATNTYELCKRDSFVVVAQLSPEFTAALVDRWQELEAKQAAPVLPSNFAEALRLAADQAEQIEQQKQALAIAAPKVEFVDRYVEGTGLKGFRQVAKLLKANERQLREFLAVRRIMYKLGGEWVPYAAHIDAGRFAVKTGQADNGHDFNSARFTPKGVAWLAELWNLRGETQGNEKQVRGVA